MSQFIPQDAIDSAYGRTPQIGSYEHAPIIIGVDPSLGGEDMFVIGMRQGLLYTELGSFSKTDDHVAMARIIGEFEDRYQADAVVIDHGGGGVGLKSIGNSMGRNWVLINSASSGPDSECLNIRAYMWLKTKEWLIDGGCIPADPQLSKQLSCPAGFYSDKNYKLQIEGKDMLRKRLGTSTDKADPLCLTFCVNPLSKTHRGYSGTKIEERNKTPKNDYYKNLSKIYRNLSINR